MFVKSFGREGVVSGAGDERIEVRLGGVNVTVGREDLRLVSRTDERPIRNRQAPRTVAPEPVESSGELNLIGRRVEEALGELDKFLDVAALAGHRELRVIHGHGTGRLRRAVREFLKSHVHVESHRSGKSYEGGDGATVVRLR